MQQTETTTARTVADLYQILDRLASIGRVVEVEEAEKNNADEDRNLGREPSSSAGDAPRQARHTS